MCKTPPIFLIGVYATIIICGFNIFKLIVYRNMNSYKEIIWSEGANFTAGDCDTANYNAWCPHNLQYDKESEDNLLDNGNGSYIDTSALTNQLTSIYSENANISFNDASIGYIENNNDYSVSIYSLNDFINKYGTMSMKEGFLIPVYKGKLIAYGTKLMNLELSDITLEYIKQYQPYCVIEYEGINYLCVKEDNNKEMMISLQRRNTVYESSVVTDCYYSNNIKKIVYIPEYSYGDITGRVKYVEISKKILDKKFWSQ